VEYESKPFLSGMLGMRAQIAEVRNMIRPTIVDEPGVGLRVPVPAGAHSNDPGNVLFSGVG